MSRGKIYCFSPRSVSFVEARWLRTKLAIVTLILVIVILSMSFEVNHFLGNDLVLGLQRTRTLLAENAHLREQLRIFKNRLQGLHEMIASLGDQENELRLFVDLPKVKAEMREAGIGGTDERIDLGVAGDLNSLLNTLRSSVTKAERELQLEQTLSHETVAKYEQNKKMYPCIPATKPMDGYFSMNGYGMRFHPVYHQMLFHEGLDIANEDGTAVRATGDGVVVSAGRTSTGLGTMIVIDHGYGYTTVYGHLSRVLIRSGQHVKRGVVIALSGHTGVVTGPHLHYEVRFHGRLQNPVDFFFDQGDSGKNRGWLAASQLPRE
jgi:murein DD-endopeptidase MepM/ murein hydrolase activator NlpD